MTDERLAQILKLCEFLRGIYKIECHHCKRMTIVWQGARIDMMLAETAIIELLDEVARLREIIREVACSGIAYDAREHAGYLVVQIPGSVWDAAKAEAAK